MMECLSYRQALSSANTCVKHEADGSSSAVYHFPTPSIRPQTLYHSGAHISRYLTRMHHPFVFNPSGSNFLLTDAYVCPSTEMLIHAFTRATRVLGCPRSWAMQGRLKFSVFAHFLKVSWSLLYISHAGTELTVLCMSPSALGKPLSGSELRKGRGKYPACLLCPIVLRGCSSRIKILIDVSV